MLYYIILQDDPESETDKSLLAYTWDDTNDNEQSFADSCSTSSISSSCDDANNSFPPNEGNGESHGETTYSRKMKAFDVCNILSSSLEQCGCDRFCNDYLSFDMILRWRKKYHTLPMGGCQKAKLVELLKETLFQDGKGRTLHLVEQHLVCRKAWYHNLLGISLSSYTRARRQMKRGTEAILVKKDLLGTRGQIALGYMNYYVSLIGDHSPERARILMPIGLTVKDVYRRYKMQYKDGLSPGHFYALWKTHMKHVSRQRNFQVSKCKVCFLAQRLLERNNTPEMQRVILKDRDEHLERQQ